MPFIFQNYNFYLKPLLKKRYSFVCVKIQYGTKKDPILAFFILAIHPINNLFPSDTLILCNIVANLYFYPQFSLKDNVFVLYL